jgi:hypothetical protein
MKHWELFHYRNVAISNEELPYYGYGDFPKTRRESWGVVEAETERKAQNMVKRLFPEERIRFNKWSPILLWELVEVPA